MVIDNVVHKTFICLKNFALQTLIHCTVCIAQPNNGQPGASGSTTSFRPNTSGANVHFNATLNTISGGTNQTVTTGSNRRQRFFPNPFRTSSNTTRPRLSSNQQREPMFSSLHNHMQPLSIEESRGLSLIFYQRSLSDDDDSDDEMRQRPDGLSECHRTFGFYSRNSVALLLSIG